MNCTYVCMCMKVQFTLDQVMNAQRESTIISTPTLTSTQEGAGGQRQASADLPPEKKTGYPF
jgi:hypothetical protein